MIEHLFLFVKYRYCQFLDRMERKRYEDPWTILKLEKGPGYHQG
nr:MAG TPA: hypothetical protein [Caudoviricetes sp.]